MRSDRAQDLRTAKIATNASNISGLIAKDLLKHALEQRNHRTDRPKLINPGRERLLRYRTRSPDRRQTAPAS